jgi:hypothetical protein
MHATVHDSARHPASPKEGKLAAKLAKLVSFDDGVVRIGLGVNCFLCSVRTAACARHWRLVLTGLAHADFGCNGSA